jgi:hypothetical protein
MTGDIDTTQVITNVLPALHAASTGDLYFWQQSDLIEYMDEALKRLARLAGVFVQRSTSAVSAVGIPTYPLPTNEVAILHQSYLTTPLRPAGMIELESRDPNYRTTPGTPDHWYADQLGDYTIGFAPVPNHAGDSMPLIYTALAPDLDVAQVNTLVTAPVPLMGYLTMCILAEAYGREGEAEMPDLAEHCRGRIDMYESMMTEYYGQGE